MRRTAGALLTSAVLVLVCATPVAAAAPPSPSPTVTIGRGAAAATNPSHGERPKDRGPYAGAKAPKTAEASAAATDHVLVRFTTKASTQQRGSALRAAGVVAGADVTGTGYVKVPVDGKDPASVVHALSAQAGVADAELDHVRHMAGWTNDQLLQQYAWPYFDLVRLPRAWDVTASAGTVVAVVDTGVTGTVPDLAGAVLPGTDLVDGDSDPSDLNGHGTAMAGIIAAHGNNTIGSAGSAYGAKILPVRVLDASGAGDDSTIAAGISWAVAHGADVINLSLSGPDPAPVILGAVQSAVAAGVVVVAAAGNDGADAPQYPAAYAPQVDGLIAVAATDDNGARPDFSTRGDWVTLAAPGVDIVGPDRTGGYVAATGTSSSAAFVSGIAALVAAHDPSASPSTIESRLVQTARDAGPRGADPYYGAGVVDAAGAVTAADATRAAVAAPLDRAGSDAGPSDDTAATARTLTSPSATGTLSPEGDQDWYRFTAPSAGWWQVSVTAQVGAQPLPDASIEVRDSSGTILADGGAANPSAWVLAPANRVLVVGVIDATGVASSDVYQLALSAGAPPPFTVASETAPPSDALALGDVTGDGVPDALVPYGGLNVYPGRGDGTFGDPVNLRLSTGSPDLGVVLLDVDGDGDLDVAVATNDGVEILRQDAGSLVDAATVTLTSPAYTLASGDLDGDGHPDLVATQSGIPSGSIVVLMNDGHGQFSVKSHIQTNVTAKVTMTPMRLADVSGDGRVDIVGASGMSLQKADGSFGPWTPYAFPYPLYADYADSVTVGDITGDGRADVVLSSSVQTLVWVFAQTPAGGLAAPVSYAAGFSGGPVEAADFDGDGRTDVLVANNGSHNASLLLGQPGGTLGAPRPAGDMPLTNPFPTDGLRSADLDGDGCRDAVLLGSATLNVLHGLCAAATHDPAWLSGITPAPSSAGVAVRPTVQASFVRSLNPATVTSANVHLRAGTSGTEVPATVSYDPATRTVTLVPAADLSIGNHYEVVLDGLEDTSGDFIDEPVRTWFTVAAGADRFTPMDPVRVADTRADGAKIQSGNVAELSLDGFVPPEATAVVLNVTSTEATGAGNVRVFPGGLTSVPTISNLNVAAGVDEAALVTVALGSGQTVELMTDGMASHLVVDLAGYYSPGAASAYEPMSPVRAMDTRDGTGSVPVQPLRGGQTVDLTVAGRNGVPADALAVVMNVTGTDVTGTTHLRVYPTPGSGEDQTPPEVSNVNLRAGRDQPNLVTVKVGDAGKVRFYTPTMSTDVIADIVGYYSATGANGYVPLSPFRAVDTRFNQGITGKLRAGTTSNAVLAGTGGVPADATAVVMNVVGVAPTALTHVRVFPTTDPATLPNVSTLNLVAGRDEANLTIQPPGVGGQTSFYPHSADMHLVVDVSGYFRR
jgi:subtilisin family serine protease